MSEEIAICGIRMPKQWMQEEESQALIGMVDCGSLATMSMMETACMMTTGSEAWGACECEHATWQGHGRC